ncbi:L,D-transpeptidase family protein [Cognatilysobacter lacus]|uniref:L,D-transpeptidase family protein n=1 Tax=Cognatilysobacter lacus TaxID=1643323 RepID=A0A5D8Z448_9GAMM|nr:L,D-transpeptidase family protein [Lysobacter lacus]TZF89519.1 L,D-transpeptidase family protein [Lysobacter lacus]
MDTYPTSKLFRRLQRVATHTAAVLLLTLSAGTAFAAEGDAPLAPGTFEWNPDASSSGPVVVVVSLPKQMVHVYRGDTRIGRSTISSGKPGHDTPTGMFEILEKDVDHHSNKYNDAPMPYMQRLTWDGVALHAGHIPGFPASHGCVRLPKEFAADLFQVTERGGRVIIADETNFSEAVLDPGEHVPVDPWTGLEPGMTRDTASVQVSTGVESAPKTQMAGAPALAGN